MATYSKSEGVREQLLDVAEKLFAERGYFGASVRDITEAAGQRLAAINYHFGTKEALLAGVIRRRAEPLGKLRLEKLTHVMKSKSTGRRKLRSIVEAFAQPMLDKCLTGGAGWKRYFVLTAQLSTLEVMNTDKGMDQFDEVARRFIHAFHSTDGKSSSFGTHCAFQFMLGTVLFSICDNKRLDRLSNGKFHSSDLEALSEPLIDYVTSGVAVTLSQVNKR